MVLSRSARKIKRENEKTKFLNEQRELSIYTKQLTAMEAYAGQRFKKELEDPDESQWSVISKEPDNERILDTQEDTDLRAQATKYYYRSPHARNIIRLIQKYVVGTGFLIEPISQNEAVKEVWDEFWRTNRLKLKKKEIVIRVMRDGEIFIRYFQDGDSTIIRFLNPALVAEPSESDNGTVGNPTWGIETDPQDIETVLAYWYKEKRVNGDEIQHHKIFVDSDVKRGRSFLEPIIPLIVMYDRWLKDRMKLNMLRAIVGLIKKVEGTPTQTENIATQYNTTQRKLPDGSREHKAPEGVSIFTTNKGVDYELKSPNLQASDVQHDGRALLLAMSTGVGLPEYMTTANSNDINFASALVAESPGIQEFQDWQDYFGIVFSEMFEKVISTAIARKLIPEYEIIEETEIITNEETGEQEEKITTKRVKVSTEARVIFPELVPRKILEETQALVLQANQGWISDKTASGRLDLDFDEEQRSIEQEQMGEEEKTPEEIADEEMIKAREEELATQPLEKEIPAKT